MTGLYPTKTRIALLRAVEDGKVTWWPEGTPGPWSSLDPGTGWRKVDSRINELEAAGWAAKPSAPIGGRHVWQLTDAGREVLAQAVKSTTMPDSRAVYRYEVPVDDQWHTLDLSGAVLHVAARQADVVEVWALNSGGPKVGREFRVFGTGHPLPLAARQHVGTAFAADGALVWHLWERTRP